MPRMHSFCIVLVRTDFKIDSQGDEMEIKWECNA